MVISRTVVDDNNNDDDDDGAAVSGREDVDDDRAGNSSSCCVKGEEEDSSVDAPLWASLLMAMVVAVEVRIDSDLLAGRPAFQFQSSIDDVVLLSL